MSNSYEIESIYDFGIVSNGYFIWTAREPYQGEIKAGALVALGFGELLQSRPKGRFSEQWVVVLECDGNQFLGLTLEDGWMTGPPASTLVWFAQYQVRDAEVPDIVSNAIMETRQWQDEQKREHISLYGLPSDSEGTVGEVPF